MTLQPARNSAYRVEPLRMYVHRRVDPSERFRERRQRARRRKRLRRAGLAAALLALAAGVVLGASFFTRGGDGPGPGRREADDRGHEAEASRPERDPRRPPDDGPRVDRGQARRVPRAPGVRPQHARARRQGRERLGRLLVEGPAAARTTTSARRASTTTAARRRPPPRRRASISSAASSPSPTRRSAPATVPARVAVARRHGLARPGRARVAEPVRQARLAVRRRCRGRCGEGRLRRDPVRLRPLPERRRDRLDRVPDEPQGVEGTDDRALPRLREQAAPTARHTRVGGSVRPCCYARSRRRPVAEDAQPAPRRDLSRWSTRRTTCRASTTSRIRRHSPAGRSRSRFATTSSAVRGTKVRIVPWLQDFSLSRQYGLAEVTDQVQAARRVKAGGFMLWNPLGVYTQEALSAR